MPADIPTLRTARLVLRGYRPEDFAPYATMWADPMVTRFIGGKPVSREQAWARFLRQQGMWQAMGFGFWVVEDGETGAFLGETGFLELRRTILPSMEGALEFGVGFVAAAHGKGLAAEAAGTVLAWGSKHFPDKPIVCIVNPANAASLRLVARQGFHETGRSHYDGREVILFERRA